VPPAHLSDGVQARAPTWSLVCDSLQRCTSKHFRSSKHSLFQQPARYQVSCPAWSPCVSGLVGTFPGLAGRLQAFCELCVQPEHNTTLYRSYVLSDAASGVLRHRGKSPRQPAFFFRNPEVDFQAAQLASLLVLHGLLGGTAVGSSRAIASARSNPAHSSAERTRRTRICILVRLSPSSTPGWPSGSKAAFSRHLVGRLAPRIHFEAIFGEIQVVGIVATRTCTAAADVGGQNISRASCGDRATDHRSTAQPYERGLEPEVVRASNALWASAASLSAKR
jgi:hypothetical protein